MTDVRANPRLRVIGSILHGAYGDYYEQALCLKHYAQRHSDAVLRLFAGSELRLNELSALDLSFAESFTLWNTIPDYEIDEFFQFQINDRELGEQVLNRLPRATQERLRVGGQRLPWTYLRSVLPLQAASQIGLSPSGRARLVNVMSENGITESTFDRPTVGFLWRYRSRRSPVSPWMQPPAADLVRKYSRILRELIDRFDCNVLICGMKVETTPDNRERTDSKYPRFGLDLPQDRAAHLKGLSWPLELEIVSRCDVCLVQASGFSEALYIRGGSTAILCDPPIHYKLKLLKHRMPLFDHNSLGGLIHIWSGSHSEARLLSLLSSALRTKNQQGVCVASPTLR